SPGRPPPRNLQSRERLCRTFLPRQLSCPTRRVTAQSSTVRCLGPTDLGKTSAICDFRLHCADFPRRFFSAARPRFAVGTLAPSCRPRRLLPFQTAQFPFLNGVALYDASPRKLNAGS